MKFQLLPKFPKIEIADILMASTLLFYGGTKITEFFGNTIYRHPYKPPAYHAAFYIEEGLFLNVGKFKVVQEIKNEFRSTRRIDIISYPAISKDARIKLSNAAYLDTSKPKVGLSLPDYDWKGFIGFGLRKLFKKVPWLLKQSKRNEFCSEECVQLFNTQGIKISDEKAEDTAPWHLLEYALKYPDQCEVKTLWTGKDFKVFA
jgi:hypothetical protein